MPTYRWALAVAAAHVTHGYTLPAAPAGRVGICVAPTVLTGAGSVSASVLRAGHLRCMLDLERRAAELRSGQGAGEPMFDRFTRHFEGHFDNREQALADKLAGMPPRQGGGHEHIHCHMQPLAVRGAGGAARGPTTLLATYHFAGRGPKPFRQRVYTLRPLSAQPAVGAPAVEMQIFRLTDETEARLLAGGGDASCMDWAEEHDLSASLLIPGCDVVWRWVGEHFEGDMTTESAIVASPILNADILVKDHLTLFGDALWVNDRGWDMEGNYLYGNIHDVPYQMDRVQWTQCDSVWA